MKNRLRFLKEYGILGLVSLLACTLFLGFSFRTAGLGFPLDDAWIHQAFARNFSESLTWSFQLGTASGGSTGPLWGFVLSLLYFFGIPEVWGTHFLGFLLLWGCSITGFHIARILFPGSKFVPTLTGIMISLEWHLVWSALSGMETTLFILLLLLVFKWILEKRDDFWIPGILTGISIWVRPDGITLLGPVLLSLMFRKEAVRGTLGQAGIYLGSLLLVVGPYFLFNHFVAGDIWPNTFYAKQAEYELLRQSGIVARFIDLGKQVVTGIGIILLPGLILEAVDIIKNKDWERAGILFWAVGYIGIYALRLPVIYQHGRYIMPAIPAYLLLGGSGLARWIGTRSTFRWKRVFNAVWGGSAAGVLGIFWILGARAYALDVGVIETEMVQVALWINENTPPNAVIGAHDIGGLGYYGEREIIDLAGLISPDVIPFIRDQKQLTDYLDEKGADYLVTFPSWYPEMVQELELIHQGNGKYSDLFGMDQMSVFVWK